MPAIRFPVSRRFAEGYESRVIIDHEKVEVGMAASNSDANPLRSMLGLPLKARSEKWPQILGVSNRSLVEDAIDAGSSHDTNLYGCQNPGPQ